MNRIKKYIDDHLAGIALFLMILSVGTICGVFILWAISLLISGHFAGG